MKFAFASCSNTHRRKTHGEKKNVNKQARALYLAKAIFNIRNPILAGRGEREGTSSADEL